VFAPTLRMSARSAPIIAPSAAASENPRARMSRRISPVVAATHGYRLPFGCRGASVAGAVTEGAATNLCPRSVGGGSAPRDGEILMHDAADW
jgi:hypothetical protein